MCVFGSMRENYTIYGAEIRTSSSNIRGEVFSESSIDVV
jgi:hypothetical protein